MDRIDSETVTTWSNWKSFLKEFFNKGGEILFEENEKGRLSFHIPNILGTSINASDQYGFISLNFIDHAVRDEYLLHAKINHKRDDAPILPESDDILALKWKDVSTDWPSDNSLCNIYVSNGGTGNILSFYDFKDITNEEKFNNRIATLKNIINSLVNLKISKSLNTLKDDTIK